MGVGRTDNPTRKPRAHGARLENNLISLFLFPVASRRISVGFCPLYASHALGCQRLVGSREGTFSEVTSPDANPPKSSALLMSCSVITLQLIQRGHVTSRKRPVLGNFAMNFCFWPMSRSDNVTPSGCSRHSVGSQPYCLASRRSGR
jgi:hypothetical protein